MIHGALANWAAPPIHVVLVGAYRNTTSDTASAIVPTWFRNDPPIGFWTPFVPTDDPYAFAPGSTDSTPVISVGRIPASQLLELSTYVTKVIAVETGGIPNWRRRALHAIEDHNYEGNSGGYAKMHADSIANSFSPREHTNFTVSHLYATDSNPSIVNGDVIPAWNSGVGYALFYGTAGDNQEMAQFVATNDIGPGYSPGIMNQSGPVPVMTDSMHANDAAACVLAMTCGNGYSGAGAGFTAWTGTLTLGQYLLFTPRKGAVSVVGPTRAMHEAPGYEIAKKWCAEFFSQANYYSVYSEPGRALMHAKQILIPALPQYRSEVMEMVALGDPALQVWVGGAPVVGVGPGAPIRMNRLVMRPRTSPSRSLDFVLEAPTAAEYEFSVIDVSGRQVSTLRYTVAAPNSSTIVQLPTARLSPGVYFARVRGAGLVATAKVVLVR